MQDSPKHVAVIMDGNRRWARGEGLSVSRGHVEGAEALTRLVRAAKEFGVRYLTVYAFSTENWNRPRLEVRALMRLFDRFLVEKLPMMQEEGVRFHSIGKREALSKSLQKRIADVENQTAGNDTVDLIMGINYGARDEICRAVSRANDAGQLENLNEETLSSFLDTARFPDPDLLIRTSGEMRVSNFLLWQIAYAEIYKTDVFWPDFSREHFADALEEFRQRHRRRGA